METSNNGESKPQVYANNLHKLVKSVFVSKKDLAKDPNIINKRFLYGGFYVVENEGEDILEIMGRINSNTSHYFVDWINNPANFHDLIRLISFNYKAIEIKLNAVNLGEDELRKCLSKGVIEQIKKDKEDLGKGNVIDDEMIRGELPGLDVFNRNLMAKCNPNLLYGKQSKTQ
jgi:hypothetical protein